VGLQAGSDPLEDRTNKFGECGPPSFTLCIALAVLLFNCCNVLRAVQMTLPLPVAARSKAWVCGRSNAGIAELNPAGGMEVCLL
jgi:hypothetical protein